MLPLLLLLGLEVPLGLDRYVPAPMDNPIEAGSVRKGRELFFDKRLSRDSSIACASCHDPKRAFSDGEPRAKGVGGKVGTRRSPRILNRAWGRTFFWDGRVTSLEEQVAQPITNPLEMDLSLEEAAARVGMTSTALRRALASYVRTILSGDSPYDRYVAGSREALNAQQQKGLELFRGKAGCISCHLGPNLTDEDFHVTGVGNGADPGRFHFSRRPPDRASFKTPTLRNVAQAPPYFHDGSAATLAAVIEYYDKGGPAGLDNLDWEMRPLHLSSEEKAALVAFLEALTGTIREGL